MRNALIILLALAGIVSVSALEVGDEPAVSVREAGLRSSPAFLAAVGTPIEYGESVRVLEARGDWLRVRVLSSGAEGWLHVSAMAEKRALRLERAEGSSTGGATSREIALAGRGFNEQVEAQYKRDKGLDFSEVDEMETYGRPVEELVAFFAEAGLTVDDGGAE